MCNVLDMSIICSNEEEKELIISKKMRFLNMAKFLSTDITTNMMFFSKTKLCSNHENGKCTFGNNCKFAHSKDELVDQQSLPCLYGPFCILEKCNRKHYNIEQTTNLHNHIYELIHCRKKNYKSFLRHKKDEDTNIFSLKLKNDFDILN